MPTTRREFLFAVIAAGPLSGPRNAPVVEPAPDRVAEIEWHILFLTNQQRIWRRLPPLESSAALARIARSHSQDMLARGFFDHRTPEGIGSAERIARQGLKIATSAENIFLMKAGTSDAAELASVMVSGWMSAKGHRQNILDPAFRSLGVGVAASVRLVLATQLFGG
jgi:uncharacterized protein YkwD